MKIIYIDIIAILIAAGLFIHAVKRHGPTFAVLYWVNGLLFTLAREYFQIRFLQLYVYGDFATSVAGVPLVAGLFWPAALYLAAIMPRVLGGPPFFARMTSPLLLPFMVVVVFVMGLLVNALAFKTGYVNWAGNPVKHNSTHADLTLLIYAIGGLFSLIWYRRIWASDWTAGRQLVGIVVGSPVLVFFQLLALWPVTLTV